MGQHAALKKYQNSCQLAETFDLVLSLDACGIEDTTPVLNL
jgi:hypothetical protein